MAVAYSSYTTAILSGGGGAGGNITVGVPAGLAEGDLWVVHAACSGAATISLSGFTAVQAAQAGGEGEPIQRVFWKIAGPSESSVTVVIGSGGYDAIVRSIRITGAHATAPIGNFANATSGLGTTRALDAPDVTIQNAGSLALLVFASEGDTGANTITRPAGTTLIHENHNADTVKFPSSCVAYELRDAGSYAPGNWTQAAGDGDVWDGIAQTIEIIPAAGGGGVTLTVADAGHGHAVDAPSLTQANTLALADATHVHAVDNITLQVGITLVVADTGHAHAVDNAALTQSNLLAVADALHAHGVDALTLDATRTFSFTLYAVDGTTPLASKTGLWWAWWDSIASVRNSAPDAAGTGASTNGSGVFTATAPGSLSPGDDQGFGIISDQDATPDATEAAYVGSFDVT